MTSWLFRNCTLYCFEWQPVLNLWIQKLSLTCSKGSVRLKVCAILSINILHISNHTKLSNGMSWSNSRHGELTNIYCLSETIQISEATLIVLGDVIYQLTIYNYQTWERLISSKKKRVLQNNHNQSFKS